MTRGLLIVPLAQVAAADAAVSAVTGEGAGFVAALALNPDGPNTHAWSSGQWEDADWAEFAPDVAALSGADVTTYDQASSPNYPDERIAALSPALYRYEEI